MQDALPLLSIHEGNPTLQPLIGRFLDSISERLLELRTAVENNDIDGIKRVSHKFRGSASTFGFPQVAVSIRRVEDGFIQYAGHLAQWPDVAATYNRLVNQCARLSSNGNTCTLDLPALILKPENTAFYHKISSGDAATNSPSATQS